MDERDGLIEKLSKLEADLESLDGKLNTVIDENNRKTEGYIDQIEKSVVDNIKERETFRAEIEKLETSKSELSDEVFKIVEQLNIATENNEELKQMNNDLAKQIARLQTLNSTQTVRIYRL